MTNYLRVPAIVVLVIAILSDWPVLALACVVLLILDALIRYYYKETDTP